MLYEVITGSSISASEARTVSPISVCPARPGFTGITRYRITSYNVCYTKLLRMSNKMGMLSLMAPWNAALKQFSGVITMTRIVEACEAAAKGTIKPKELEKLAAAGINRDVAEQIAAQFSKHGGDVDGVKIRNNFV